MPAERLAPDEIERYQGHITLPDLGTRGQLRLRASRVLLVGVGGLGCPVAQYLVAAGVGSLTLLDDDIVDATNLQRQVLFGDADLGRPKVEAAAERLSALNRGVEIEARRVRVGAGNARSLVAGHDLVIDGSDNFATRYVVNDAAVLEGVPLVTGSLYRYEGQVTVVSPPDTPCYRCLFRSPPPDPEPCREAGVLGPLAGVVGSLQAAEAVRLLAGSGPALGGRLLLVDLREGTFRTVTLASDPECPLCGADPVIHEPTAVAVCDVSGG